MRPRNIIHILRRLRGDGAPQTPSPILRRIKTDYPIVLIDLGAHHGVFTRALTEQYRISRGILVEPLPQLAEDLRRQFRPPVYEIVECALSDREGTAEFEVNETEETSSLLKIKRDLPEFAQTALTTSHLIQVRTRTLDSLVRDAGLDHVDLLKVDVQGAEDKVLAGAIESLSMIFAIWIEVSFKPLYEGSAIYSEIYRTLDKDFRLVDMQPAFRAPDAEILQSNMLFLRR